MRTSYGLCARFSDQNTYHLAGRLKIQVMTTCCPLIIAQARPLLIEKSKARQWSRKYHDFFRGKCHEAVMLPFLASRDGDSCCLWLERYTFESGFGCGAAHGAACRFHDCLSPDNPAFTYSRPGGSGTFRSCFFSPQACRRGSDRVCRNSFADLVMLPGLEILSSFLPLSVRRPGSKRCLAQSDSRQTLSEPRRHASLANGTKRLTPAGRGLSWSQ